MHNHGPKEKAANFWPSTWRLLSYLGPWKIGVAISILLAVLSVILSILAPKVLGQATTTIYDGLMKGYALTKAGHHLTRMPIDFAKIGQIAVKVVLLYAFSGLFSFAQQVLMTKISQRVVFNLRQDLKAKMARLPIAYYDGHQNGDMMSRMVNDMDNIAATLQTNLLDLITSGITFIGVLVLMLSISWQLTLVAAVTIPLSIVIVAFVAPAAQRLFAKQQAALGEINGQVEEDFNGQTIVRVFNHETDQAKLFAQKNQKYYKAAWMAQFFSILIYPLMHFISNLGYLLVAVVGVIQVGHGQISLGNVQAMLQYSNQFSQPITQIANLSSTIQQTIASAERIFKVLDAEEMDNQLSGGRSTDQPSAEIAFDHVQFAYEANQSLIEDFNLQVPKGKTVAIVGPTGAGKTTIINLLERFYEVNGGHIYFRGQDTKSMSREDLRSHLAMVLQDTWLFTGTIFDNIKYGRNDATDEEVIQAAKMAHADGFIRELPDGYQTVLDESASNISQGQRQLLTIARAFLANPDVLILDEATSSVDTRTEQLIQQAMDDLQVNRTNFVVAHRLSTIRNADQIIVLNHGHIMETGNHESLMAKNGFYADLYNSQFIGNNLTRA